MLAVAAGDRHGGAAGVAGLPADGLKQQWPASDRFAMMIGIGQAHEQIPPVEEQGDHTRRQTAALEVAGREAAQPPLVSSIRRRRSRYAIDNASDKLTKFDESSRVGFQALSALARWLGSRDEQTPASACLADAAAGSAARCHPDIGTDGSATASARLRGGDGR
jgi:hypothetical protein